MRGLPIDATGAGCAVRVYPCGGCACGACTDPRAQSTSILLFARARSMNKQHRQQSTNSFSAAVYNAHDDVNDVEAAPCQLSAAYGRMTLPAFAESSR